MRFNCLRICLRETCTPGLLFLTYIYLHDGFSEEAFPLFEDLLLEGVELEFFVFLLSSVVEDLHWLCWREIGRPAAWGCYKEWLRVKYLCCKFIDSMYGRRRSLGDAKKVFNLMKERDCVSWNSVVMACTVNGEVHEALEFLYRM